MSGHSPIDSLRRLAPVSDSEAVETFGAVGRDELLAGVTDLPVGRPARPRPTRRRQLVLAAAVVAAAATAATAWAVLRGSGAHETTSVECVIQGVDTVIPSTSGDPAQDCAVEWKRELGNAAPPLRAYDNGLGGVTVIPRTAKPQSGWKRLVSGQDVDLIQLQDSLDDYVNGLHSSCFGSTAATAFTEARLAQFGFTGWTVAVRNSGSSADTQACVGGALVDPTTESVMLGSEPAQSGPKTVFEKLAVKLQPVTQGCKSLPAAVAAVRATASSLGLSESPTGYDLNTVTDRSMRCASIYETVGGTIFLTVRGPHG